FLSEAVDADSMPRVKTLSRARETRFAARRSRNLEATLAITERFDAMQTGGIRSVRGPNRTAVRGERGRAAPKRRVSRRQARSGARRRLMYIEHPPVGAALGTRSRRSPAPAVTHDDNKTARALRRSSAKEIWL